MNRTGYKRIAHMLAALAVAASLSAQQKARWICYYANAGDQRGLTFYFDGPVSGWASVTVTARVKGAVVRETRSLHMKPTASFFPIAISAGDPVTRIEIAAGESSFAWDNPRIGEYNYFPERDMEP